MSLYFDPATVTIAAGTRALASQVNTVSNAISAGFDKLPTEIELKLGTTRYAVDTGAADAYIVTLPYVPTLTDGFNLSFKTVNANTGASTINVNSLGIKSIVNTDGSALVAGTFGVNAIVIIAYESGGDRFILVSQNPGQAALAQASAVAAAASAAAALVSENNAATSETNAGTSETNAGTSETNAGTSETNAAADAAAALATRLLFEQSYLGSKASDPTLDNEGNALIDGALYFNTTVNQMNVYDLGGAAWGPFQDGGNAATLDGIDSTQFLRNDATNVLTTAATTVDALAITETTMTTGILLDVTSSNNGKVGTPVARVTQSGATSTANAMEISQSGSTGIGLKINSSAGDGLDITPSVVGARAAYFHTTNANRTVAVVEILNDNATGTGNALTILNDQGGDGIAVTQNNAAGQAGYFFSNTASRTAPLVEVVNDNVTGTGVALRVQGDQGLALDVVGTSNFSSTATFTGLFATRGIDDNATAERLQISDTLMQIGNSGADYALTQTGSLRVLTVAGGSTADLGANIQLYGNNHSTNQQGMTFRAGTEVWMQWQEVVGHLTFFTGGTKVKALTLREDQEAVFEADVTLSAGTLDVTIAAAAQRAGRFYSNVATRTVPVVDIVNDHVTGSGIALRVQQDASAPHIDLVGTNGEGIRFPATAQLSTNANTLDDYQETDLVPDAEDDGGTTTATYSFTPVGRWTKIGNMVFFNGRIEIATLGDAVGGQQFKIRMGGMPNIASGTSGIVSVGLATGLNITASESINGIISSNLLSMQKWSAATGATNLTWTEMSAGGKLTFSGMYQTTA